MSGCVSSELLQSKALGEGRAEMPPVQKELNHCLPSYHQRDCPQTQPQETCPTVPEPLSRCPLPQSGNKPFTTTIFTTTLYKRSFKTQRKDKFKGGVLAKKEKEAFSEVQKATS